MSFSERKCPWQQFDLKLSFSSYKKNMKAGHGMFTDPGKWPTWLGLPLFEQTILI